MKKLILFLQKKRDIIYYVSYFGYFRNLFIISKQSPYISNVLKISFQKAVIFSRLIQNLSCVFPSIVYNILCIFIHKNTPRLVNNLLQYFLK